MGSIKENTRNPSVLFEGDKVSVLEPWRVIIRPNARPPCVIPLHVSPVLADRMQHRSSWHVLWRAAAVFAASLTCLSAASAQSNSADAGAADSSSSKFGFSMHVGVARGMSALDRQAYAGSQNLDSHYRVRASPAWGAAMSYAYARNWGARADVDAIGPVQFNEVSRNATMQGQSIAWLTGLSLTYSPRSLCGYACVTLSAGPGAGFYELGEHTEVAKRSFAVSRTQLAFATRAGLELRAPGRFQRLSLGVSDYIVNFAPAAGSPDMTLLHHVVVGLRWSPP